MTDWNKLKKPSYIGPNAWAKSADVIEEIKRTNMVRISIAKALHFLDDNQKRKGYWLSDNTGSKPKWIGE